MENSGGERESGGCHVEAGSLPETRTGGPWASAFPSVNTTLCPVLKLNNDHNTRIWSAPPNMKKKQNHREIFLAVFPPWNLVLEGSTQLLETKGFRVKTDHLQEKKSYQAWISPRGTAMKTMVSLSHLSSSRRLRKWIWGNSSDFAQKQARVNRQSCFIYSVHLPPPSSSCYLSISVAAFPLSCFGAHTWGRHRAPPQHHTSPASYRTGHSEPLCPAL